jgi:hypothetical protein
MRENERGAIGGTSQLGTKNINYSVMPEQVTKTLQSGNVGEFILIQQTRQGEQPQVWSSGDPEQTSHLFNHASQFFPQDAGARREPATT